MLSRCPYDKAFFAAPHIHVPIEPLRQAGYQSQYGQDQYIHQTFLNQKRNGIFIDLGAFDGITLSNTYALEKNFGWTGLAVEPMPSAYEKLKRNRTCHLYNGCISEHKGDVEFQENIGTTAMLSGIVATYCAQHQSRITKENTEAGTVAQIVRVPSTPLWPLLQQYDMLKVDYLTVDTEGSELSILAGIPFDKMDIDLIDVENNYRDPRIFHLLTSAGYKLVAVIGCDEIYRKS